jgi:hypothetical protein
MKGFNLPITRASRSRTFRSSSTDDVSACRTVHRPTL